MNNIAILTTAFNHTNNHYFKQNWKSFCESIDESGLNQDLYICEILPENTDNLAILEKSNHYTVYNNSKIWHKESALNFLINKLPDKYKYVLLLDNDIIFENLDWYNKLQILLESYGVVQPFDTIKYFEENKIDIETTNNSMCCYIDDESIGKKGNPGMAVAYNRDYLNYMNGLFDECIVGGGDALNIMPFFINSHTTPLSIFRSLCRDSIPNYVNYMLKANSYIHTNKIKASYLKDSAIKHLFHGYLKDRQYSNRYNIINNKFLYRIVKKNNSGFYEYIDSDIEKTINQYFDQRESLRYIDKPKIITNSKYGCDNENVLWLTPCDTILCRQIEKMNLSIRKHHHLDNIKIFINNKPINTDSLLSTNKITLTIDNPSKIEIYAENPPIIHNDDRELGLLITEVDILNKETGSMEKYPLCDIM